MSLNAQSDRGGVGVCSKEHDRHGWKLYVVHTHHTALAVLIDRRKQAICVSLDQPRGPPAQQSRIPD